MIGFAPGKSFIQYSYCANVFPAGPTIFDHQSIAATVNGQEFFYQLWDTAGNSSDITLLLQVNFISPNLNDLSFQGSLS